GLYYLRARYLDPSVSRFLTMDQFGGMSRNPETLNKYVYAGSDPVNNVDPSGHEFLIFAAFWLGFLAGGAIQGAQASAQYLTNVIGAQDNPAAGPSAVVAAISANFGVGTIATTGFAGSAEGLMTYDNGKWFGYLAGGVYVGLSFAPLLD